MNQVWEPKRYQTHAGFVPELGAPVLELLEPEAGERILDLGCGDGTLTLRLIEAGAEVVGVDSSQAMVDAARARGIDARVADARALEFDGEFSAVFSNAALHWIHDADAVLESVSRALVSGGRFVAEFGGHGCVAAIVVAMVAVLERRGVDGRAAVPWYFPSVEEYRTRLSRHGFAVDSIALIPRPTPLPTDMRGWLETFAGPFVGQLAGDERSAALDEAVELLRPALCDGSGQWTADYVRLRFRARSAQAR